MDTSALKESLTRAWHWLRVRLTALWTFMKWFFHAICCCGICLEAEEAAKEDLEKGRHSMNPFGW